MDAKRAPRLPDGGFTLIEILIAMVLLGVGMLGLSALGVTSARTLAQAEVRTAYAITAADALEQALYRIRTEPGSVSSGVLSVDTLDSRDIVTTTVTRADPRWTVTVTVAASASSRSASISDYTISSDVFVP